MKDDLACPMIRKFSSVYVFAHSGFAIRCCPMADSQLILELFFLHIRGGCSLTVLFFFLMLGRTCCFIAHLIANPKCARTYTDENFRTIGQARSSFHLSVLESVYIKTQNPVLCRQNEFVFSLRLFR